METPIRALAYLCIGVTGEVIFTGLKAFIYGKDKRLQGFTQIWVMPMYAVFGVFLFEPLHLAIIDWNILIRFSIYALGIFLLEYIFGWLYKQITGSCPWEYKGKWNIHGYINLPHFPGWGALGLIGEVLHNYMLSL